MLEQNNTERNGIIQGPAVYINQEYQIKLSLYVKSTNKFSNNNWYDSQKYGIITENLI